MKKLNLLKTIVDYVWFMSLIVYPLIIIVAIMFLIDKDSIGLPIKISGNEIALDTLYGKIALLISLANFGIILFALFNFRKLMSNFKNRLIFETESYLLLNKIGHLIIYSSFIYLISEIFARFSKNMVAVEFGFGPFVYLLALGLFFVVLSEVFKIGKRIKEENELTI
ncbi:MAG: DUF2975 domain-containing protein [Flavobacterium sp.]|uniref:DUF2975 domain-containing protein n=1 Tax=Flavobacterium sp. TaxID=239 RepID=UPI00326545E4